MEAAVAVAQASEEEARTELRGGEQTVGSDHVAYS